MKKFALSIFICLFLFFSKANALTFEEAFTQSDSKPMAVLVYAQWADDYQRSLQIFKSVQEQYNDLYNFVEMDIADKSTHYFNQKFHIYPHMPYILIYRNGGKISRYLPNNCAMDASCITSKLKTFIQN